MGTTREITLLHVSSKTTWRGGEQQMIYLAKHGRQPGFRHVLFLPEQSASARQAAAEGLETCLYPLHGKLSLFASVPFRLAKAVRQTHACLVHCHDSDAHTLALASRHLAGMRLPIVVSRRVDFPVGRNPLSAWKYKHSAVVKYLCVSKCILSILARTVSDARKLEVVHSGIDPSRFPFRSPDPRLRQELGLSGREMLVGNVAALAPHKDYFTFLDTAARVLHTREDVVFVIVGSGPLEQKIRQYARQVCPPEKVIFTGFREDIPVVLPGLDVLLFTSRTEGLGTTLADALVCGVPVVATRAGGIPEIIQHERNGLTAVPGDVPALAQALLRMLGDADLRKRLSVQGLQDSEQFTAAAMARNTLKVYARLCPITQASTGPGFDKLSLTDGNRFTGKVKK